MPERDPRDMFPPHDIQAERAILASMMLSGVGASQAIEELDGHEFYSQQHRKVFDSFMRLYSGGQPLDAVTAKDDLEKHGDFENAGGMEFLVGLFEEVASAANIASYIAIVKERQVRRLVLEACVAGVQNVNDPTVDTADLVVEVEKAIYALTLKSSKRRVEPLGVSLKQVIEEIANATRGMGGEGILTGYTRLDSILQGFQPGEMIIVAGRPSMGKSALLLNFAERICIRDGIPGVLFSIETAKRQLNFKLIASRAHLDSQRVRSGTMKTAEIDEVIAKIAPPLYDGKLYLDDEPDITTTLLSAKTRSCVREYGARIIFVDYLQFLAPDKTIQSREQQVAAMSRGLKTLGRDLNIPVVVAAQINRSVEGRKNKLPMLSDLRESGSLEQDSDVVLLLHRPAYYDAKDRPNELDVIVAKNRNGPTGMVTLTCILEQNRVENMEYREEE